MQKYSSIQCGILRLVSLGNGLRREKTTSFRNLLQAFRDDIT